MHVGWLFAIGLREDIYNCVCMCVHICWLKSQNSMSPDIQGHYC